MYAKAREEYETSTESLLSIAKKHGVNYNNLRHFLQLLRQLREDLDAQLSRLQEAT